MQLSHKLPAAVLAVLAAATWAVPAAIDRAVEEPQATTTSSETVSLEATGGSVLDFRAPGGWTTTPSGTRSSVTYTKPKDEQTLHISVLDQSKDFDTTADRVLRQEALAGTSAAFDGGTVTSPSGFSGKSCVAIKPDDKATGPCAVVHKGDLVVAVTATSTGKDQAPDLQSLVDSFTVAQSDAAGTDEESGE
ncbi:hypothetical protein [Kocuria sp.]|uniref:hypothetical protein n=1 Tax=Kocuria sp. TaxID=1871328 RepID=UPI0026DCE40A|nr:hypothetical protein [Kocuria sp.]MDO4919830.1 hypothetical protein [Kocuria sp.]